MTQEISAGARLHANEPLLALRRGAGGALCADIPMHLCVGHPKRQFLFGGTTMAACVEALEIASGGKPVVNATCQFVAPAQGGQRLEFLPQFIGKGRIGQAVLEVLADGQPFARMLASVGRREGDGPARAFVGPGTVPAPLDCPERSIARRMSSNMQSLMEFRLIDGVMPDRPDWTCEPVERMRFWLRARAGTAARRPMLAMMGDFLAMAVPGATGGAAAGGTSLDNTIRFCAEAEGDRVLCDARVQWLGSGLLHGELTMFDEGGTLLAIATQTMVPRG